MTQPRPRTVLDVVRFSARRDPSAVAVLGLHPDERLTYGQLLDTVIDLTTRLRAHGVTRRDAVLVSIPDGPAALVGILGAMSAAVCAPVNPAYTVAELAVLADDVQPAAVVTAGGSPAAAAEIALRRGLPLVELGPLGAVDDGAGRRAPEDPVDSDVALLLHTAGTTARPKQVPLTHANLAAAAGNVVDSLRLTPRDRCLNVMPLFHSHGLLGAAMSTLRAGAGIVCTPGLDPRHVLRWAVDLECTWYTAASTLHQLVLDAPGEWPGLRFMRSASGPLAPQVAKALEQRFGAPMIEVYGMTEAYQIAANPLPPGERRLGTVGRPTGTDVGVLGSDGGVRRIDAEGELVVRGPAVFAGYSSPVTANDDAFVDGWFRTGDLGRVSQDGYVAITGRVKEQINRGGEKIAPREVEEALLDHPDVLEAMAFGFPDPRLGEEIGVALVLREGASLDLPAVRRHLDGRVAPFKVPRRVVVVGKIPKTSTGKPQRLQFAREHAADLAEAPSPQGSAPPADDDVEARLAAMWQDILGLPERPAPHDRFFDLGGTSLAVMELVVRVEQELAVDLPLMRVLDVPVLADFAAAVEREQVQKAPDPLLHRYRQGSSGIALVLVPGQFGQGVGLDLIADAVDADVDVWLFDYPGHRAGESPARSIDELANVLVRELDTAGVTGNVALYGNSLGSWVAFEAARTLAARGWPPLFVGIGDLYSPYFTRKDSPTRPTVVRLVRYRLRRIRRKVARWRATTSQPQPAAVRRQQAVAAASARALHSYDVRDYDSDVIVFSTPPRAKLFGPTLGWDRHGTARIRTVQVAGDHGDMHRTEAEVIGRSLTDGLLSATGTNVPRTPNPERAPTSRE